jgi:hypothetical protein
MKTTKIESGYQLTIESWENDGDHYATKTLYGLTLQEVKLYVDLVSYFESGKIEDYKFGNMYEPTDEKLKFVQEILGGVIKVHDDAFDDPITLKNALDDPLAFVVDKLLGYSETYAARVIQGFTVLYWPDTVELQDVTAEFM